MSYKIQEKFNSKSIIIQDEVAGFIKKTYQLLEDKRYSDIVSWSDCGNYLVIKDASKFTQTVLPAYFKHDKMNSFVRQLNLYGFRKKRTMTMDHVYHHDLFKRGRKELLPLIKRKNASEPIHTPVPQDIMEKNAMLEMFNQNADAKIHSLEAKLNELIHQNNILTRQISQKQRQEGILEDAFSQCFGEGQPTQPPRICFVPPQSDINRSENPQRFVYAVRVDHPRNSYSQSAEMNLMPSTNTPDTNVTNGSHSGDLIIPEEPFFNKMPNGATFLQSPSYSYDYDDSALNKRRVDQNEDMKLYEDGKLVQDETSKNACLKTREEYYYP